jgi:hypothetical protein
MSAAISAAATIARAAVPNVTRLCRVVVRDVAGGAVGLALAPLTACMGCRDSTTIDHGRLLGDDDPDVLTLFGVDSPSVLTDRVPLGRDGTCTSLRAVR